MNGHGESADEVARRMSILSKFSRLTTATTQRRRLDIISENPRDNGGASSNWLTGCNKIMQEQERLGYAEVYRAEYQDPHSMSAGERENGAQDVDDDESCIDSDRSTITALPSLNFKNFKSRNATSTQGSVLDFERTSTARAPTELPMDDYTSNVDVDELRKNFFTNYKISKSFPIADSRELVIDTILTYNVVIIEGATGCGKTTQVPVYILEDAILDRKQSKAPVIYVTQPRKIAARSIAKRVCDEHNWQLGSLVGYQVGLEKVVGPQTVLVFCTAGVLLQKLITEKTLQNYSHIIIDEAHERDADTDLLMMMIRTLMRKEMSFFRLIIMSATMDMLKLKSYFTFTTTYGHRRITTPSIIKIGQVVQPTNIQVLYLDKLRTNFQMKDPLPILDQDNPEIPDLSFKAAEKIIVEIIPHLDTFSEKTKSTLVFLPGLADIQKLQRLLRNNPLFTYADVIPLHSSLSATDQQRVFDVSRSGFRKVILATNIAESSITVADVGFIIDFCLTKTLIKDGITRFPTLRLQWATKDRCIQRAGRTGRCCPGKVFRMVTQSFYDSLDAYAQPELLTAPLELSVLRVKSFQMGEIKALLAVVLDPPPLDEIRTAVLELKQIGALSSTYRGVLNDLDGDMTELGRVIASLPIDVHLSKLIVIASIFDVLEDAITVAACLSTNRSVIRHDFEHPVRSYENKLLAADGSYSDLFICMAVYKWYVEVKDVLQKSQRYIEDECYRQGYDEKKLHEVSALVEEIRSRLEQQNIRILDQPNRSRNRCEDELMLKVAFCASFYPNYFLTKEIDPEEVHRSLVGLDPTKTVTLHSLPIGAAPLYASMIVDQLMYDFRVTRNMDIYCECSRAHIVFKDGDNMLEDSSSGIALGQNEVLSESRHIEKAVFKSLILGKFNSLFIQEYNFDQAAIRKEYYDEKKRSLEANGKLPKPLMKIIMNGPADNSHLLDADENGYSAPNYVEVEHNTRQDEVDRDLLAHWESSNFEMEQSLFLSRDDGYKRLGGPSSPIEISFRSVLQRSSGYTVDVDFQSVNAILLDSEYETYRRQMLVAGSVAQSRRGRVQARDTTLMPNIRGLASIMSLLFAQYCRMLYNEKLKCLTGAIFGLGWNAQNEPIDRQYEVELSFDVHIIKEDIDLINKARALLSELIKGVDLENPTAPRAELQQRLRNIFLALIKKRRFPMTEIVLAEVDFTEGNFFKDNHNVPKNQVEDYNLDQPRVFLPPLEMSKKYDEIDMYRELRINLDTLESIKNYEERPPIGGIRCHLCTDGRSDIYLITKDITRHLDSTKHMRRVEEFQIFEQRAYHQHVNKSSASGSSGSISSS